MNGSGIAAIETGTTVGLTGGFDPEAAARSASRLNCDISGNSSSFVPGVGAGVAVDAFCACLSCCGVLKTGPPGAGAAAVVAEGPGVGAGAAAGAEKTGAGAEN